jgi:hypothetical protein
MFSFRLGPKNAPLLAMALVRILIDAYSLLHNWLDVAPGKPRHSAVAREELIHRLTQYYDACGTPITVIFDGSIGTSEPGQKASGPDVEVLYARAGQTADQIIERLVHRLKDYGEVLVVTDDSGERETVAAAGGMVSSCANFIQTLQDTLAELERQIESYNLKERSKFHSAS